MAHFVSRVKTDLIASDHAMEISNKSLSVAEALGESSELALGLAYFMRLQRWRKHQRRNRRAFTVMLQAGAMGTLSHAYGKLYANLWGNIRRHRKERLQDLAHQHASAKVGNDAQQFASASKGFGGWFGGGAACDKAEGKW
eukprot:gene26059-6737_t